MGVRWRRGCGRRGGCGEGMGVWKENGYGNCASEYGRMERWDIENRYEGVHWEMDIILAILGLHFHKELWNPFPLKRAEKKTMEN